jgi:hypothetical protein
MSGSYGIAALYATTVAYHQDNNTGGIPAQQLLHLLHALIKGSTHSLCVRFATVLQATVEEAWCRPG